jgi:cell shape-determining protein MreD
MLPRLLKQAAAVVLGCLLYFFVLMPHLPPVAQHQPFRLDWGLVVIVWICLVLYGAIELALRLWQAGNPKD